MQSLDKVKMGSSSIEKTPFYVLQEGLYRQYQYGLPDEPRQMARFIMHVLESNGYYISNISPNSTESAKSATAEENPMIHTGSIIGDK